MLRNVKSKKGKEEEYFITVVAFLACCVFIKSFIIEENRKQTCEMQLMGFSFTQKPLRIFNKITLGSRQIYL